MHAAYFNQTLHIRKQFHNKKNIFLSILIALKLIFNVNQSDYIPDLVQDAGIRLSIPKPWTDPFLQNSGLSVATGLQTEISLVQVKLFNGSVAFF